ncbi:MAG TPA: hypothetical protein VFQ30_11765 [Ktedonobacteraceae bacterium]|nr:hypothetical protein [Ktedonobacteraceae bacterium]
MGEVLGIDYNRLLIAVSLIVGATVESALDDHQGRPYAVRTARSTTQ